MLKGIDVSENNGVVDWQAVKNAGISFAIIRVGYGKNHLDSQFYNNINGAINAGLKVGVYHYSYALTREAAAAEAEFVLHILKDCGLHPSALPLGIWYDMEDADGYKARHGMPDNDCITDMCSNFIVACNRNGYSCGIYASYYWLIDVIQTYKLASYVPYWCAQWGRQCDFHNAKIWQSSDNLIIGDRTFDEDFLFE